MIFYEERIGDSQVVVHAEIPIKTEHVIYDCSFVVCENPACECDNLTIRLALNDEEVVDFVPKGVSFTVSLKKRELKGGKDESKGYAFLLRLLDQMDENDWDILWRFYIGMKYELVDDAPIESFDVDFSEINGGYDEIDEGRLVFYDDVFPYSPQLIFKIDGDDCLLAPGFCLARGCGCADVLFCVAKNPDYQLSLFFDYRKNRFRGFTNERWDSDDIDCDKLVACLMKAFPDLCGRLKRMHERLSGIYKRSREKYYTELNHYEDDFDTTFKSASMGEPNLGGGKVGRNDPCPCGSGKKYKKCCLA